MRKNVSQKDSGKRLDAFLVAVLKDSFGEASISRVHIRKSIEGGFVRVNDVVEMNPARKLRHGNAVEADFQAPSGDMLIPNPDVPVTILFEDDHILVLDKPAGVQMHPAGRNERDTVANFALSYCPKIALIGENPIRPGIVHRLDRNTSGIVVLAKMNESFYALKDLFKGRAVRKTYLALVFGIMKERESEISLPILTRTGTLRRLALPAGKEFPLGAKAKEAMTAYRVRTRYEGYDLLEVMPKTGRTHQIRAHFSAIGHPVVGDRLYGGRCMKVEGMPARQLLHAARIEFELFGKKYVFESPLPDDFSDFLAGLREKEVLS